VRFIASNTNMAPSTFIPDLNESPPSSCTSLNDKAACASRLSPNPKRSIAFYPFDTICNGLDINNYPDEGCAACASWYDAEELKAIKKTDVIKTLSMMNGGVQIPEENPWYCSHGLESYTREGSTRKKANRANARKAVLDEQDLQWEKDMCDPEAIANAYSELSRQCQDAAVLKAIQDQDIPHATSYKPEGGASFTFGSSRIALQRQDDDCRREIISKAA
jgi:hypothetical protein